MKLTLTNTALFSKPNNIGLEVVGLKTLMILVNILSTSVMFIHTVIKNRLTSIVNQITRFILQCISIFMSSVRMYYTFRLTYQTKPVLT